MPKWNQAALLTPPLGLAYVAGTLDAAGYDVSVIDAVGEAIEQSTPWGRDCALIGLPPDEVVERIPGDGTSSASRPASPSSGRSAAS